MHDVVMKGVTCYKDASEHDRVLQWERTVVPVCPRWRTARCDQLDDTPFRCGHCGDLLLSLPGASSPPHPRRGGGSL